MPKKKGGKGANVTLKIAKKAIRITPEGKRRLVLNNMGIRDFPKSVFKLSNIDELDLSRNFLQTLPDNLGKLTSLRRLDLHGNKLESVPESIGNLVGLTHLNLANNRLTSASLPSSLGSLTNLKSLNLGLNWLDDLPSTLGRLDSLQELGLFDNRFTKLPSFLEFDRPDLKVNWLRNPLTYAQGCGEVTKKKVSLQKGDVYVVHEISLCSSCFHKCKTQGERLMRGGGGREGGGDMLEERKSRTYSGLMTPNSVAIVNQDMWRIKRKGGK
ncbi:leucine-rich repeat-containing protein 18 [Cololabis saira]|uniref:leucine-rich repeat-containing protein 18 n=1 Tax=Cololabis saira TaxID=129043 RepID=UPI002AD3A94F|nr:leucine-rich repeat-containing protein 18 [Cololabis saira]